MTLAVLFRSRKQKPQASPPEPSTTAQEEEAPYRPISWSIIRKLLVWLKPYRWHYATGIALGMAHVLLEMLSPKFMQVIIDYVTAYTAGRTAEWPVPLRVPAEWLGLYPGPIVKPADDLAIRFVVFAICAWGVVFGTALILQRFMILILTAAGEHVQFDIRRAMFAHLQRLSMSFYDKTKLGRIISRCTSDINAMREVNVWGIWHVIANSMMMAVAAAMLLYTDWRLFAAVAWLAPVLFIANRIYKRKSGAMWQQVREGFTRVSTNLAENITGVRVVTAFNRQGMNLETFNNLQVDNTANNMRAARVNGVYLPLLQLIGFTGKIIILLFGGYLVVSNQIDKPWTTQIEGVGAVVAAYLYWDWFMNPILNFGNFYNQLMMAMAGGERVFNLLETPPEVQDVPNAKPLPRIRGQVTFENVTFGYHPDRPVLHDISFQAEPGQMFALVGATGSGKSSIISLIARFYQPQKGRILVDGYDIRYVTGESLHKQMGLVLQVNYLFSGTVLDNIRYVRPQATLQEVIAAAKALGTHDAIMQLSHGYDTDVGERGANMSLGQRQLICFTRAFLADPRIFMLDEATSAVDTATEMLIQQSLERLLAGRTTFVVAHRLSTIMRADQILVIDAGRIIERGTHEELVALKGKYAQLYRQFVEHNA